VLFGANSIFAGDKLLTTPNPDVNDDMEMFEMLGLTLSKPFTKVSQPTTVEAASSQFTTLGENQNGQDQVTQLKKS
jgi:biotin synthase